VLSQTRTYGLTCTEPAEALPVSIEQARLNCRIDGDCEDERLTDHIKEATRWIQEQTEAALITSTWQWTLDKFPQKKRWLDLPVWPVQSIASITYVDVNSDSQTIAAGDIVLRANNGRSRLALEDWAPWPATRTTPDAIQIEFVAGYGDESTDVPSLWQRAILLLVGHWFANAEATSFGSAVNEIPLGVNSILETLRDPDDIEDFDLE
jgi:uncharacterized phiE125 gp8 family phage protein